MDFFKALGGRRVFSELRQILEEKKPIRALWRLNQFNLLKVIHPKFVYNPVLEEVLSSADRVLAWYGLLFLDESCRRWVVYLLALTKSFSQEQIDELCDRLEVTERYRRVLIDFKVKADLCVKWMEDQRTLKNSTVYGRLRPFPTEILLYMIARTDREGVRRAMSNYFTRLRSEATLLRGNDLKEMGFEPGPIYRKILGSLLDARLNRQIKTREDEMDFVRTHFSQ
jgi:tRNA nucleotidyltransferase (CCA-adding enzyme)